MTLPTEKHAGSFRDPDGFVFRWDRNLYRQVNQSAKEKYDRLIQSGLYQKLVDAGQLVAHNEVSIPPAVENLCYRVIQPEPIPFITYPYEWCFSQLKAAALLTLQIQREALQVGLTLKDASAYNIQFRGYQPVLIDTLSFDLYEEGKPWAAYRQFCQHFVAPLALMVYTDIRLSQWMRVNLEGIPLDLASRLLPFSTHLNMGLMTHLHLHASAQKRSASSRANPQAARVSRLGLLGLLESLEQTVRGLHWKPAGTEWADYYTSTNYSSESFQQKSKLVSRLLDQVDPHLVWDLGANDGTFSRLASQQGAFTVAMDIDPAAVEQNYLACERQKEDHLLPLLVDLTNPSPAIGWANQERQSLFQRSLPDCVMALALIHHLAISNNLPLPVLAKFFADISNWLIIEFVPKEDTQVQRLLASRPDIFPDYHKAGFEDAFGQLFMLRSSEQVPGTSRWLYLFQKKANEAL